MRVVRQSRCGAAYCPSPSPALNVGTIASPPGGDSQLAGGEPVLHRLRALGAGGHHRLGQADGDPAVDFGPQLHAGRPQRVRGLQGMAALDAPPALRAVADLDVEAPHNGPHHREVFLILRRDALY